MLGGRADISRGCNALPLKRLSTMNDTGDYKARLMVLDAVFIIFELRCCFSTAERPVCVTIEGEYFLNMATLFHDRLARHLQILWHDCMLFIICMALRID